MKTLSCKDMGMDDDFVARGSTEDAVINQMFEHHKTAHPESGLTREDIKRDHGMHIKDE